MTSRDRQLGDADLRRKAEAIARTTGADSSKQGEPLSAEEARQTLHELQVHQIELKMQNEELRRAQVALDAARARYFDLYDLAPVGYVTVSEKGLLLEANLTAAALLGVARNTLVGLPFSRFVLHEDQDTYYLHHKKLFEISEPQACELRMVKQDGTVFWAHMEASAAEEPAGTPVRRIVLVDISDRKRTEEDVRSLLRQVQADKDMQDRLLGSMTDEVWFADTTGHFTLANPAACKAFALENPGCIDIQSFAESLEVLRPDGSLRPFQEAPPPPCPCRRSRPGPGRDRPPAAEWRVAVPPRQFLSRAGSPGQYHRMRLRRA